MYPGNIVKRALEQQLDILAICDHNSAENVQWVKKAVKNAPLHVLGGMEISSAEEVHVLALFERDEDLLAMQDLVYDNLPGLNNQKYFGDQVVVNDLDEVLEFNQHLLIGATLIAVDDIVEQIHAHHGLAIASHIDREGFGIIGQLGFIPPGLPLDALEISDPARLDEFVDLGYPVISSSDAHELKHMGRNVSRFTMEEVTLAEMKKALLGEEGRKSEF
jgi:PHP family Zn ribbon phosphoesterase